MIPYSVDYYEQLFTSDREEILNSLRSTDLFKYRVKSIWAGVMLECEIYPVWITNKGGARAKKTNISREAQHNLNNANAQKKVVRLINANFVRNDIKADFTYRDSDLPKNEAEAKRDMKNYIRRLRDYIKKNKGKYSGFVLKYLFVTECVSVDGETVRVHHHMIINFRDREILENLWTKGDRTETRRLSPNDYGLTGIAKYVSKAPSARKVKGKPGKANSSKRYTASLSLVQPKETIADTKITKRRARKLADNPNMAKELFERLYKGYLFVDMKIKYSKYVSGVYLYVEMRKQPGNGGGVSHE